MIMRRITITTGARYFILKIQRDFSLKREFPKEISLRAFFTPHAYARNKLIKRAPIVIPRLMKMKSIFIITPHLVKSFTPPLERAAGIPMIKARAPKNVAAFLRVHFFSSTRKAVGTSRRERVEVSTATRRRVKNITPKT